MLSDVSVNFIAIVAFIIWSFPLTYFRSRFRKMVYDTDSWLINIKPVFWEEIKVLFGYNNQKNRSDRRLINFYRFYLIIYFFILAIVIFT